MHAAAQPAAATHTAAEPSPRHKDPKPAAAAPEDPFEGISDGDIAEYSDIFDVPPPEGDTEAAILGAKIRKWVAGGKQDAGDSSANRNTDGDNGGGNDDTDDDNNNDNNGHDSGKGMQGEQPKRKRGRFGFLGK